MTYTTKNATIVFVFAAMLMAMPLTMQSANAETNEASVPAACGFQPSNIAMTAITRGAQQAESPEATFPVTGDENTAAGTFVVTASGNWHGDGDRASTTIQAIDPVGRVLSSTTLGVAGEITSGDVLTIGLTDVFTAGDGTGGTYLITPAGAGADATVLVAAINALSTTTGKTIAVLTDANTITLFAKPGTAAATGDAIQVVITTGTSITTAQATLGAGTAGVDGTTVTVNSKTYYAAVGVKRSNIEFSMDGSNLVDAENLAASIAANDSALRTTTSNSDTVTVKAYVRGTGGNAFTITTSDDSKLNTPVAVVFTGGGANDKDHLLATNTKYKVTNDGTTTSFGTTTYGNKVAFNTATNPREMIAATSDNNIRITLQTDTTPTAQATGTITFATAIAGNDIAINGLLYTGAAGDQSADNTKFSIDTDDTATAASLAQAINADTRIGLFGDVTATANLAVVTLVPPAASGAFFNDVPIIEDETTISTSGVTMTGGAEPLFNLPYDGALKMTVVYTVEC